MTDRTERETEREALDVDDDATREALDAVSAIIARQGSIVGRRVA